MKIEHFLLLQQLSFVKYLLEPCFEEMTKPVCLRHLALTSPHT